MGRPDPEFGVEPSETPADEQELVATIERCKERIAVYEKAWNTEVATTRFWEERARPHWSAEQRAEAAEMLLPSQQLLWTVANEIETHKALSLIERIVYLTKADAKVQIDRAGEVSVREYFQGALINVDLIAMRMNDCINALDKFDKQGE